jgi:ribosome-associated protein
MPKQKNKQNNENLDPDSPDVVDSSVEEISKSQRKRDMHNLQDLGQQLVDLPKDQFDKISLEESLRDAIVDARHIRQHGAKKRQLQYIGKIMRNIDAGPIKEQLDTIQGHSIQATQMLHNIERWRDRLLEQGDQALEELVIKFPQTDRQYMRQILRNAQKEKLTNKPPKSARILFSYLRELLD